MSEDNIPSSEKLLLLMHNLCAMRPEAAKTATELANVSRTAVDFVINTLSRHEADGYVRSYWDQGGAKRFYLTEVGIIRVCSFFT